MFLREKKMGKKAIFRNKFMTLFLCCTVLMFCFINYFERKNFNNLAIETKKIMSEIQKEKAKKVELSKQKNIYNNYGYIEKVARQKLGMIKSDEIIFYIEDALDLNQKCDGEN